MVASNYIYNKYGFDFGVGVGVHAGYPKTVRYAFIPWNVWPHAGVSTINIHALGSWLQWHQRAVLFLGETRLSSFVDHVWEDNNKQWLLTSHFPKDLSIWVKWTCSAGSHLLPENCIYFISVVLYFCNKYCSPWSCIIYVRTLPFFMWLSDELW